ncbi:MAG TPA: 2-oxoacid:acceptor oxidoreductase subunit alpha, partial [Aggregatilineales bacterium]|nr:2-oxoacid:acceptor oxidoreductase subunit alpha [Aggregatilineales bacterium]
MTDVQRAELAASAAGKGTVVNDFQIIVATVNGTGSQTANTVLIRALFRMGIPVTGKNIFPSNIQGLPTWFTIRLSKEGYIARRETSEILVAMNRNTLQQDIDDLPSGGVCFYPAEWKIKHHRDDIVYYPMPVNELVNQADVPRNLRDYVANMVYVGALAALLEIDLGEIEGALNFHFDGKQKPVDLNMGVVRLAYDYAMDHLPKVDPYRVERMNGTGGKILLDGNSAAALGSVFGGVSLIAWYPITPSTSLIDAAREYLKELRIDPETGKATYAVIQAEDELAAIGMVVGAGWAGARAMTATSGPGISLMAEFAGLAYFAEVPAVIWDVQRVGPSTGLPTRTSQGDVLFAYTLGHGDTKHPVLLPADIKECFEFGWRVFDLAERLQTLVFVLSDLDLGMNLWMSEPFEYPDEPMDRGKVLTAEDLERLGGFSRYKDVDGDGIAYRTLPGTDHRLAAYFTRGTGHNERAIYSEAPEDWVQNMERLNRKFNTARDLVPQPVIDRAEGAQFGLIAYGTTHHAVVEA